MVYLHIGITSVHGLFKHIGVKFGVARFDYSRQFSGALNREASNRWASRSVFICFWKANIKISMRSPIVIYT